MENSTNCDIYNESSMKFTFCSEILSWSSSGNSLVDGDQGTQGAGL